MKKILILAANPKDTTKLRLDEEVREIQEGLQRSRRRDQFAIISRWAVRTDDLRRALLDHEPQVVHFLGHGAGAKGLILEDDVGQMKLVSASSLARLFKLFQDKVECVVLNACYSEVQAEAIQQHIDYVIGMNQAIGDRAAIEFAVGFYDGLGAGRSYADAFEFGLSAIDLEGIPETATPQLKQRSVATPQITPVSPSNIFLSYKRNIAPDETVALELCQALESHQHRVFMDIKMAVGTRWVERIEQEIFQADVLIVLLSEAATCSEMVQREIELARQAQAKRQGLPVILPVRLAHEVPFSYPLSEYLGPLNWAIWRSPADTPQLIEELMLAIAGQDLPITSQEAEQRFAEPPAQDTWAIPTPFAPPPDRRAVASVPLERPTQGTMRLDSRFYVERPEDARALEAIQQPGITITIKGARQMGKSSLLSRVTDAAQKAGKQVVFIDFQFVEQKILKDADAFFQQFCLLLADELDLEDEVLAYWQRPKEGNLQRCTRYVRNHILGQIDYPLVLAMDEVERIFVADFRTDFFSMLRGWHNNRARNALWQRLDLALVTSTEPYLFINDRSQSPFNVGEVLDLRDFSLAQVADLNQRHGAPLAGSQVERLTTLVHGHPYLVRRALYLVACQQITPEMLFNEATQERGPFGDHLRHHLSLLHQTPELMTVLYQVIRNQTRLENEDFFRLRGAGLVRKEVVNGKEVIAPRCPLYADYFREHLRG